MATLIKLIVAAVLSLTLFSCNFDINLNSGVRGDGNVTIETRTLNKPFITIAASKGLDVYLTQGNNESLTIEADENLHELIITEIKDGVLKIHTKENIGYASSKKVHVTFKDISNIIATSGSDVYSTNTINAENLGLTTTSGSDMTLDLNTSLLNCKSTSGSDLRLSGKTGKLIAIATSGSDIKAADLKAESSEITATSGADVIVNTSKELTATATSGGGVKYYGNPKRVSKNNSSSGSISQQ